MSSSYRNWSSGRSPSSTLTVEPSTYGTSWNSIRWNKPSPSSSSSGYRSHSSRIAASFESDKPSYSVSPSARTRSSPHSYTTNAAKIAANLASLGPPVSARASRFDSSLQDKYRTEARDLISKYTSKERPSTSVVETFTSPRSWNKDQPSRVVAPKSSEYPYRKSISLTPTRTTVPALSRYSDSRTSLTSPTRVTPTRVTPSRVTPPPVHSHVLKQERPWRARMAEGARVRALHGDDVSSGYLAARSSRRSSIGRDSGDELSSSISALRNYVSQPTGYRSRTSSIESRLSSRVPMSSSLISARSELAEVVPDKMTRSYSPMRSSTDIGLGIPRFPTIDIPIGGERTSSMESLSRERQPISSQPKNPTIRESSKEDGESRRRSSRSRTARRNSRQRSQTIESSSDEEDISREKEESRRKRRASRKRSEVRRDESQSAVRALVESASMVSIGDEKTDSSRNISRTGGSKDDKSDESFYSCAPSPKMGLKLSKSASQKKMVPTKKQVMKSPSYVEVSGAQTTSTPLSPLSPTSPTPSNDISISNKAMLDDESQYSAVAHFKPTFKPRTTKPAKPVPGLWKKDPQEENISKNKTLVREEEKLSTAITWKSPPRAAAKKSIKMKSKAALKKEKDLALAKAKEAEKKAKDAKEAKEKKAKEETMLKEKRAKEEADKKAKEAEKKAKEEAEKKAKEEAKKAKEEAERRAKEAEKKAKEEAEKKAKEAEKKAKEEAEKKAKEEAKAKALKKLKEKPIQIVEKNANMALKCFSKDAGASRTMAMPNRLSVASPKMRAPTTKAATMKQSIEDKRVKRERCAKTLNVKRSDSARFSCGESRDSSCIYNDGVERRPSEGTAKVSLDAAVEDVNMSRVRMRLKQPQEQRKSMPSFPLVIEEHLQNQFGNSALPMPDHGLHRSNSTRDAYLAVESRRARRGSEDAYPFVSDPTGPIVLPDKSVLEEYVKRKRGHLERVRSGSPESENRSECDSPANSTSSEFVPASEVRIFTRSPRHSVITTPSRSSRVSSVEAPTPTMDTLVYPPPGSFNAMPQGFLRHGGRAVQIQKPLQFDEPKTPFEQRLQNQANRIRATTEEKRHSDDLSSRLRFPVDGMPSSSSAVSSGFTAAIAASQPRHERYAAHLPVKDGRNSANSGRQSAESNASGALDTASKQLEHMIDQARQRHQVHRSKFKEAIDYLDNIFEDLRKECDVNGPIDDRKKKEEAIESELPAQGSVAAATRAFQNKMVKKPQVSSAYQQSQQHSNSLPTRSHHSTKAPVPTNVDVSETIVLPKKTDRLDFTRRWLADDLSSFAKTPPTFVGPDQSQYGDADEHSVGSCSAEVAAINTKERKKKTRSSKPEPLVNPNKPAPCRPQAVYAAAPNNNSRFPLELEPPQNISRVASYDRINERLRPPSNEQWRSGSQEPYSQTMGSVRSDDQCRPSPSAFQYFRGGLRGSLRSLPDAGLVLKRNGHHQAQFAQQEHKDPAITIDALVAELELNTDQMTTSDKHRSFPTARGRADVDPQIRQQGRLVQPAQTRFPGTRQAPVPVVPPHAANVVPQPKPVPYARGTKQPSLDEVTNMLHVVSEIPERKKSVPFAPIHSGLSSRPFDTINQERLNPSRVEAIQNMFENRRNSETSQDWRHPAKKNSREEDMYYDIGDFASGAQKPSPPHRTSLHGGNPSSEVTPPYPTSHPPTGPPPGRNGSATSSQNGGYYSSTSSYMGNGHNGNQNGNRRGSIVGRQSMGSRGASVDDEDDGFYDNIGIYNTPDDRRFSRGSEMDNHSISSRYLPPSGNKPNRIGSFLSKIGGRSTGIHRPPGSAASLVSLNKVAAETQISHVGNLVKSSSLSMDPWRKHVMEVPPMSNGVSDGKQRGGLGARLKNSLFGSKKRLN